MLIGEFNGNRETFVHFHTSDLTMFRYAWGSRKDEIQHGSIMLIHAPSHWDDYRPEHKPGEDAFYNALREAYKQFNVHWVLFVYWPEKNS